MFFKWYGRSYAGVLKCFTRFFVQMISIAQKQTGDMLQASYMGYKKQKTAVSSGKETIISMASTAFVLKEVQVKGSRITGRDTISFDLTRFANERDNSLKDVLKKLPGVDIEKNGRINYNGIVSYLR